MKTLAKIFFLFVVVLTSCKTDPNTTNPTADDRDKYVGNWTCVETPAAKVSFSVSISKNPGNSSEVLISNFNLLGVDVKPYATVSGTTLTIPTQWVCSNTTKLYGNGILVNDAKINLQYTVIDTDSASYNATYTKQP
ncbi:MAG: hypothetical protein WCH34_00890 [Bacteroidota bacterium]